ncbi:MAG: GEVED domain-containing protein, partial [Aequorivita sp.]
MKKITLLSLFLLLSCSVGLIYGQNKASTLQVKATAPAGANFQTSNFNRSVACDGVLPDYTNSLVSTNGVASQIFPDFGNSGMFAADDFMVVGAQDALICQVDIEGVFFGGGTTLDDPSISIRMTIHADAAGKPGAAIFTEDFPGSVAGPNNPSFSLSPTNAPVLTAGVTYWMSVQAVMPFNPFGQWGWVNTTDGNGSAFMFQDPDDLAGSGCPSWELGSVCTGITEPDLAMDISFNAVSSPPVTYCTSSGNNVNWEYITNVTYAGINNTTTTHAGYNDFTALVANVNQGDTDQISVTIEADSGEYLYAFIDWNKNGILDDAGEVYTLAANTSSNGPHTMNITVPAGASLGDTRMRVKVAWGQTTPNPCGTFSFGEVEDYTVRVQGPVVGNPPIIVCPSDITSNNDPGLCTGVVNFANAIAIDPEDGVITTVQTSGPPSGSAFPVGTTTIEFSATDSDG